MTYLYFRIYLCQYITHFLISTSSLCTLHVCISLITAFWMVYCLYCVFVCICCAAPDKLTSPPSLTGLGALQSISRSSSIIILCSMMHVFAIFSRSTISRTLVPDYAPLDLQDIKRLLNVF